VCLFREPDAVTPPVRFDEREQETEPGQTGLRRAGRKPNPIATGRLTSLRLFSTLPNYARGPWPDRVVSVVAMLRQQPSTMAGMNQLREHPWFVVAALVLVFLGALSMHAERMAGWGFLILCFVVGSLCGLGLIWIRNQAAQRWSALSKLQKRIGIATGVVLVVVVTFASNRHKPDEFANDAAMCFALVVALLLWGLARLMSRLVDALHARFSKR
jgi:hypothetical protein